MSFFVLPQFFIVLSLIFRVFCLSLLSDILVVDACSELADCIISTILLAGFHFQLVVQQLSLRLPRLNEFFALNSFKSLLNLSRTRLWSPRFSLNPSRKFKWSATSVQRWPASLLPTLFKYGSMNLTSVRSSLSLVTFQLKEMNSNCLQPLNLCMIQMKL